MSIATTATYFETTGKMTNKKKSTDKLIAKIVKVKNRDLPSYNKTGVVMDDDTLHNGVICCRVIIGDGVHYIEADDLQIVPV